MAKVKITGHASGTGVLTITAPNTSTDRTITLPDTTGTLLDENSSVPAANLTGTVATARLGTGSAGSANFLRGDGSWQTAGSTSASDLTSGTLAAGRLPSGSVLQVINAVDASETSTTSSSLVDTGLTATITPSATSSKILIMVGMNFGVTGSSAGLGSHLLRGSSIIRSASEKADGHGAGETSYHEAWVAFDYLDSPSTTSATTYKMQMKTPSGGTIFTSIDNNVSTMTLMEIGA